MLKQINFIRCLALLTFTLSACQDTPPETLPPTPIEARLPTVDFEATQPVPDAAIQIEITPNHLRVSLDRLAPIWQRASALRDAQIADASPRVVSYMMPKLAHWHDLPESAAQRGFSAVPSVYLMRDAAYIRLLLALKPILALKATEDDGLYRQ